MDFEFLLAPIRRQIRSLIGWALVEATAAKSVDNGVCVNLSLPAGEHLTDVPMLQQYGFTSMPNKGSKILALFMGGCHADGVAVGSAGPVGKLPSIEVGEAAFYTDAGQKVLLKKDGSIVLTPAAGKTVRVESNLDVKGDVIANCDVVAARVTLSNHLHPTGVGPSSKPTPGT